MLIFAAVIILLIVALIVLQLIQMRRPAAPPLDLTPLERNVERTERGVRDEIGRNREEAAVQARDLREELTRNMEAIRGAVDTRLRMLQEDSAAKLEQMRITVDEQLQGTLERRLGESFRLVSDRLEQVYKGLGEMQTLASGVGDLKKVLTDVRARGAWGEVQLGALLDQMLAPNQYERNVATKGGSERVEYAIRLPGSGNGTSVWLPIDAKFPQEDFIRLIDASEKADAQAVELCARQLETRIRSCARDICEKYINPPMTTDFAIMYLPTESLYSEALRRPGLVEALQSQHRICVAGPTTLGALLNSLQMGFRTLAIQKQSSEVWNVLGEVKTEFSTYADVLTRVHKKLQEASNTVDRGLTRTRAIERKLRNVEAASPQDGPRMLIEDEGDELEVAI
jgi:DNA recombination protein RmuC